MTIKSATPNGSQRERAPGGWARVWPDNAAALLAVLTKPWPAEAMTLDLDLWVDRVNHGGEPMPGRRCLAARWGVGERTARTVIDRWRESSPVALYASGGPAPRPAECPAEGPAPRPAPAATMPIDSVSDAGNRPAERPAPRPAEGPAAVPGLFEKLQPVAIVAAPQTADMQTADKTKKTRAKAKPGTVSDEEVSEILAEMHAVLLPYYPSSKPPTISAQRNRIAFALNTLAEMSRETGRPARHLLIAGFRFMADGNKGYWQRAFPVPSKWYEVGCQAEKVKNHAEAALQLEAATYIPSADEALDAVLEVGCADAEARYPAAARAIRQAFDFSMGGDLARMRAPKDPQKMRAAWASGFTRYLSPPPALALVSR